MIPKLIGEMVDIQIINTLRIYIYIYTHGKHILYIRTFTHVYANVYIYIYIYIYILVCVARFSRILVAKRFLGQTGDLGVILVHVAPRPGRPKGVHQRHPVTEACCECLARSRVCDARARVSRARLLA